jgi:HSP20 family molecular chaperone IbpA
MSRDELSLWMWSEACRLIERADAVQRQFAGVVGDADAFVWEPPADVYETEWDLRIVVALPGVRAGAVEVSVESCQLVVRGERELPAIPGRAVIRRMELPHGRFERRIRLPAGHYEFAERGFRDGCLLLVLNKIA